MKKVSSTGVWTHKIDYFRTEYYLEWTPQFNSIQFNSLFHQFLFWVQFEGKLSLKGGKTFEVQETLMFLANLGPVTFFPFYVHIYVQ